MMSLIHVFHGNVEANVPSFFISDVAVAFDAQAVVDIHRDFVADQTVPDGVNVK